jgi:hypothetical protein
VPALATTGAHQSGHSTPLRPGSQWAKSGKGESTIHLEQQSQPIVPASAIPACESSLRYKHASPHIEQDYDEYRNMLARSAVGSQKHGGDVFHEGTVANSHPTLNQQQASCGYGRRQIQATDSYGLDVQDLSIVDNGTGTGHTKSISRARVHERSTPEH